ncbi:MAG: DDE-type integrase/transposase/recombinase [Sedimenticola sp.]
MNKKRVLEDYYFNIKNPAAYGGVEKLYRVLTRRYPGQFTRKYIDKWLEGVDSYSVLKQVRRKFRTPNVRVTSIDEQFDVDLMSVQNIAKENDGVNFLLCAIDIFSRFLFVEPMKNKTAKSILAAIKKIFQNRKPKTVRTDKGSEFVNRDFKGYMRDQKVYFFTTQNQPKANYVERVQRTLKTLMYRYLRKKRNYRYIDDIQRIVDSYNATPHRSLNYIAPKDVSKRNEADLWAFMYLKPQKRLPKHTRKFKLDIGDYVRISYLKEPFRRAYQQQYTTEIFKVKRRYRKQGIPVYRLTDWNDEDIKGIFYGPELNRVAKDADTLFYIEKILKRRQRGGKRQLYVSWEGYPASMNSWIDADQVTAT